MTFIMMALSLYAFMKPARMSSLLQENGCAYSEEHAELKDVFFHGDRYSLVTALTVDGYIASNAVPGSFDSMDSFEFIQEMMVCSLMSYRRQILTPESFPR